MKNQKHYLAAISAFVIWGVFSIPLRAINGFSPETILYYRILFSAIFLLLILFLFRKKAIKKDWAHYQSLPSGKKRLAITLTLTGGLLLTVNWLMYIYIVNQVNVKTASFAYLICPVLTAVFGFILLKEHMTKIQWLAVFFCIVSCVLIGIGSLRELTFSFITAISYALYLNSQRKNQGFDSIVILTIQVIFSLLMMTFSGQFLSDGMPESAFFYTIIAIVALGFTVLPLFLNLFALTEVKSSTVGILLYINPLINFVMAMVIFHENVSTTQIAGYLFILLGLILFNVQHIFRLKAKLIKQKI